MVDMEDEQGGQHQQEHVHGHAQDQNNKNKPNKSDSELNLRARVKFWSAAKDYGFLEGPEVEAYLSSSSTGEN